jgi:hypothetical protein
MADDVERAVALVLENWDQIGVEERDGILHLPASIKRRNAQGGVDETPVRLRVVLNPVKVRARREAREWALKEKLDLDRDLDLVDMFENYCILSHAIRDLDCHTQHVPDALTLWRDYDPASISELWGRYDAWVRMQHPSFGNWDGEKMWQVIARIRQRSDISFLAVMPGFEQASCILLMAREACCSPNAPSFARSSGTSTPAS